MTPTPEEYFAACRRPTGEPMTRRDVARFSISLAANLSPEDIDAIHHAGNLDPEQGIEWMPWYKASLSIMAELAGLMARWLEAGRKPTTEAVADMKRLWKLHLMLGGIGPVSNGPDAARRKAFIEGETDAVFFVLEGGERTP